MVHSQSETDIGKLVLPEFLDMARLTPGSIWVGTDIETIDDKGTREFWELEGWNCPGCSHVHPVAQALTGKDKGQSYQLNTGFTRYITKWRVVNNVPED